MWSGEVRHSAWSPPGVLELPEPSWAVWPHKLPDDHNMTPKETCRKELGFARHSFLGTPRTPGGCNEHLGAATVMSMLQKVRLKTGRQAAEATQRAMTSSPQAGEYRSVLLGKLR